MFIYYFLKIFNFKIFFILYNNIIMKNFLLYILIIILMTVSTFSFYFILIDNKNEAKDKKLIFSNNRSLAYNFDREQ